MDTNQWASIAGAVVNVGFSVVVGWYLLTKALPQMQSDFVKALSEQRSELSGMEKDRRTEGKEALAAVLAHCERESVRHAALLKEQAVEHAEAIKDNRETMEEVRDALKDVRQSIHTFVVTSDIMKSGFAKVEALILSLREGRRDRQGPGAGKAPS